MTGKTQQDDEILNLLSDEGFQDWVLRGEDDSYWTSWVKSNPDKSDLIRKAQRIIRHLKAENPQSQVAIAQAFEETSASWDILSNRITSDSRKSEKRPSLKRSFKYAASIVLVSLTAWLLYTQLEMPGERVVYRTGYNEKRDILLSDQTRVKLNSNSVIEVYADWEDARHREVKLIKGEAFFNVTKQTESSHPKFTVTSHGLTVEVLGTAFNVKSRRGRTATTLVEGSIAISLDGQMIKKMKPGELIVYHENNGRLIDHSLDLSVETGWLENKIVFHNTTLTDVAKIIEDNYGVEISVAESVLLKKLSGELPDKDLDILMKAIAKSLQVEVAFDSSKNRIRITQNTN